MTLPCLPSFAIARAAVDAGVDAITLHGRSRTQRYRRAADWEQVARLVEAVDVPVIGNGDVVDGESFRALTEHTRCHGVMVARGAIGNPWLFARMRAVDEGSPQPEPEFSELCRVTQEHIRSEVRWRGEQQGCLVVRKHIARCFRGYRGAAALRRRLFSTVDSAEMLAILDEAAARGIANGDQDQEEG